MAANDVTFGAFNLNDGTNYLVTRAEPPHAPHELLRMPLAYREGSVVAQVRHAENMILVEGLVHSLTSFSDAEAKLDAFILALADGEQNMKLNYADERYWKARLHGRVQHQRISHGMYSYTAEFLAADPFAYAASASQSAPGAVALSLSATQE